MATVVFADLVGSTGIFERLGDETAGRFVTQLTTALSKTFEQHNGRVIKLLGDGLFVVFPAEPQALAGFTVGRFKPRLVCIEAHPEVRQRILDYFAANGYVVVAKYLRVDKENLWFMPAGTIVHPFPAEAFGAGGDRH